MGFRSYIKNTVKANTNVKGWSGWDTVKKNATVVKTFVDDLKVPETDASSVQLTFEAAMKKYGMTEADVAKGMKARLQSAWICLAFSIAALVWMVYLFYIGMFLSGLVSLSLSALMAAYGFREHFYYFQMKRRKLNCTINEWASSFLKR